MRLDHLLSMEKEAAIVRAVLNPVSKGKKLSVLFNFEGARKGIREEIP